jgi:hypothetical protein
MKRFFEGLKDILYDGIDYIMMAVIIVIVALIINWRLGGLFAKDGLDAISKKPTVSNGEVKNKPNDNKNSTENTGDAKKDNISNENSDALVKITIPKGSLPSKIGDILADNGLVKDKDEFVKKAIDMKLETKLKYGEFEIPKGSSMEEILQILTK